MELKEYIAIIRKNITLFISIIFMVIAGVFLFFFFQPEAYETSVLLNITRQGKDNSQDYKYDGFYRLQADERFADTVVQWLKSPRIVADILGKASVQKRLFVRFEPQRRSSQAIFIDFKAPSVESAKKISISMAEILDQSTQDLNVSQKEENWFMIMAEDPVVKKYQPPYLKILIASLFSGMFVAFWAVMGKHYFK